MNVYNLDKYNKSSTTKIIPTTGLFFATLKSKGIKTLLPLVLIMSCQMAIGQLSFTLEEAIDYAIENSNQMKMAQLEVRDAEAQISEFKSYVMPKLSGRLNYQYYFAVPVSPVDDFITPAVYQVLEAEEVAGVEPYVGPPDVFEFTIFQKHNVSANLDASMVLFDGSYTVGLEASKLFRELTSKSLDVKQEEITSNVTKAYMNILIAKENKKTLEKNMSNVESSLRQAVASFESGFAEHLDVERLELSVENIKTDYENLDDIIDISKDLLKFQMNYPINDDIELSENIETLVNILSVEDIDMEASIDYTQRAEYNQIEMGYAINELNVKRLKKGYLPSVTARANFNESLQRNNLFDSNALGWIPQASVSLGVNVPIYDGNERKSKIKRAEIELDKIAIQKSEFERAVDLQVRTAQLNLKRAKNTLANRERTLLIIEGIYSKTQIKFKEGVGSSLEITQAEQQLYLAQSNYINALYELLTSKTDLEIALGTL